MSRFRRGSAFLAPLLIAACVPDPYTEVTINGQDTTVAHYESPVGYYYPAALTTRPYRIVWRRDSATVRCLADVNSMTDAIRGEGFGWMQPSMESNGVKLEHIVDDTVRENLEHGCKTAFLYASRDERKAYAQATDSVARVQNAMAAKALGNP